MEAGSCSHEAASRGVFHLLMYTTLNRTLSRIVTQPILQDITDCEQTGFLKGRNIATNITKMIDVIDFAQKSKLEAIIMLIDVESALITSNIVQWSGHCDTLDLVLNISIWVCAYLHSFNYAPRTMVMFLIGSMQSVDVTRVAP